MLVSMRMAARLFIISRMVDLRLSLTQTAAEEASVSLLLVTEAVDEIRECSLSHPIYSDGTKVIKCSLCAV